MNSFTSRSRARLTALVVAVAGAYAAGAIYTLWGNPEVRFWKQVFAVTSDRARKLEAEGQKKLVLAGDSSCSFQLDGRVLAEEFGLPTINGGMHAGLGLRALLAMASTLVARNDMMALHFQPEMLVDAGEIPPLGYQVLIATGALWRQNDAPLHPLGNYPAAEPFLALRPGLSHAVTMVGKILTGRPAYRYSARDIGADGTLSTSLKEALTPDGRPRALRLDPMPADWLANLHREARQSGITIVYVVPVKLVEPANVADWRASSAWMRTVMGKYFRTLDDGRMGAEVDAAGFADTVLHFDEAARARKTRALGAKLREIFDAPAGRDGI